MGTAPLLHVDDLRAGYGEDSIIDGIDLSLAEGDTLAIVGPSGGGKTTLLRAIALLIRPQAGRIAFQGEDIFVSLRHGAPHAGRQGRNGIRSKPVANRTACTFRRRLGMVFQDYNLWPHLTLADNISAPLRWLGTATAASVNSRVHEIADRLQISAVLDSLPARVSGGQRQRAALARALVQDPALLLLDEVTAALDPDLVVEILELIEELRSAHLTMIVVTHHIRFAQRIASHGLFLAGRHSVGPTPAADFFDDDRTDEVGTFLDRFRRL